MRPCLFCLFRGGWGVKNSGKPAYIILAHSLKDSPRYLTFNFGVKTNLGYVRLSWGLDNM